MSSSEKLTRKDFDAGIDVRWCPGCGDYAVLAAMQRYLPTLNLPKEKMVFISGIGCAGRFPYYMNTFGFHTIHGRAPAVATGLKSARPDLDVWVITGDGDALSIGGNHLLHVMRRNVNLKILLFNNRIYGLTKGQYSPTSEAGKQTKSTPLGSIDYPLHPLSVALGADCSFVARVGDTDAKLMQEIFHAAHQHQGTAFIEILQNCPVFNDGAFVEITDKKNKKSKQLVVEDGKELAYGEAGEEKVFVWREGELAATAREDLRLNEKPIVFDSRSMPRALVTALAEHHLPVAMGILRREQRPVYEQELRQQIEVAKRQNTQTLADALTGQDTWVVT